MNIVNWCNDNQGFLMAFLTLIYVIATVFILAANSRSTKIMQQNLMLTDKIQKENAKLALHTKRLDAFDTLNQLVIQIHLEGPKRTYINELMKECKTVYYLFDDSIDTIVKKILFDIQRLRRIEYKHKNKADTPKDKEQLQVHTDTMHSNILEGLNELTEKVNDYLDIGEYGVDIDVSKEQKNRENDHKKSKTPEDKPS